MGHHRLFRDSNSECGVQPETPRIFNILTRLSEEEVRNKQEALAQAGPDFEVPLGIIGFWLQQSVKTKPYLGFYPRIWLWVYRPVAFSITLHNCKRSTVGASRKLALEK